MPTNPIADSKHPSTGDAANGSPTVSLSTETDTGGPVASSVDVAGILHPPQADGEIGRLGGYRILRVLGRGGMGVVFLAEDAALGRSVALKAMLPTAAAEPAAKERFLREARAAAMIKDDHVVTIHHVSEDNGVPFLVMELLAGESLADRVQREGRLPPREVIRIGRQLALGLAAAHAKGLQHRDVKPANAWLESPSGRVKLLDFGLARPTEGGVELTKVGAVLGTPAYMPPEQARGEATDHRSDLFSLGVVLYQLATGVRPFTGDKVMAVLLALVEKDPLPPHQVCNDVPAGLSALIMQLLAKRIEDRPESAAAVCARLVDLENEKPVRHRRARILLVGTLILAIAIAGVAVCQFGFGKAEPEGAARPPEPAPVVALPPPEVPPDPPEPEPVPVMSTPAATPVVTHTPPIDSLQRATHVPANRGQSPDSVVAVLHDDAERFTVVTFSPDGKCFAAGTKTGLVKVWDIANWKGSTLTPAPRHAERPSVLQVEFSPNSKLVAAAMDRVSGGVSVWDAMRAVQTGRDEMQYADRCLAFSRNGAMLATAGIRNEEVRLYDIGADGKLKKRPLDNPTLSTGSVAFTPAGDRLLAFSSIRNVMRTWDPKTGKVQSPPAWWPKELGAEPHSVVFSPGGDRVAFPTAYHSMVYTATTQRPKLREFDPPLSESARSKFQGDALLLTNVAFGSDDGRIVTGYADGTVRVCHFGPDGGTWRTVCAFPGRRVVHVAFSPEGRHVAAVSGGDVYIIRLPK